jgi:putative protease
MAKAKKAKKSKAKLKRKKVAKKPLKKAAKKKVARKPAPRPRAARPTAAAPTAPAPLPGERIGVVTHYYGHLSVAVVKLDPGTTLRVGDNIHIKGHTSDFGQRVESLQIGHAPVQEVGPNDDFGLKVADHAREHDIVYRMK